uniref:Replication factor C small subunit n=1 Tax=viral metagenome TaxID=1070528 RepID=A0A6C0AXN4_9ZZZZ|tara:strand:- start:4851 stop:5642 length:792 start_codon:yes stop_codon:yes gene_type:complete
MKEKLDIHNNIIQKLDYFISIKKIPNIIFHGPSGSGKRTIVFSFINKIYNNDKFLKYNNVMFVNCAQGKGIKFIREELKFFAKTHINYKCGNFFKTIILSNADKLTIDAQSALRRCIELFSHTTRFFIIVEDKYKLLKPIMSRFSEIYVPLPYINNSYINLYQYNLDSIKTNNLNYLKKYLTNIDDPLKLYTITNNLYNKGITGLDIIDYIENTYNDDLYKYQLLLVIQKVKKELKNEKLIILFILNCIFFRYKSDLENILCM